MLSARAREARCALAGPSPFPGLAGLSAGTRVTEDRAALDFPTNQRRTGAQRGARRVCSGANVTTSRTATRVPDPALKTLGLSTEDLELEDDAEITLDVFKEGIKKKMLESWSVY
ncbi:EF-hand calcium-binding domain-containing protein 10 isoform X2 [Pyrgilauda ruficollis]|uniref:EF-hand calcium-binding domain-containing protein 10 isoform X2 n=1 Tax=Pyrgilauda ruficollis TaxID=221976 RepID=UPI001B86ECFC|nr:EF-hand calcium-binding domain-containing protein 10 isoform X2 [Pyrgilauda ruficollis]